MNKRGQRFIEKRVKISSVLLKEILFAIKTNKKLSWSDLASLLGISEHSIRHGWLKERNTIPLSLFEKMIKMHPSLNIGELKSRIELLEPFWGQRIGKKSRIEHRIKLPEIESVEFAEFYGMLLGDGCVYSNLSGFCISSNSSTDKNYFEKRIVNLVSNLFGIWPKIYYSKRSKAVNCVIYGKKIVKFLLNLGFPSGKKSAGNLKFLNEFFSDKALCKACLRGLTDTDGSICGHPNAKIMLNISNISKSLLDSCSQAFVQLGIPVGLYGKGINLYGKNKLELYFRTIGSSNLKHIYKYKTFLSEGKVPDTKQTEAFLNKYDLTQIELPYYGPVI